MLVVNSVQFSLRERQGRASLESQKFVDDHT